MIVFGVISLIVGAVLYFMGTNLNNDMDAQMESFFNDGITNPGSTQETIGIILMIVGVLLIIVGAIMKSASSNNINTYNSTSSNNYAGTWLCRCGTRNSDYNSICSNCNTRKSDLEANNDGSWVCPMCGCKNQHYVGTCGCGQERP